MPASTPDWRQGRLVPFLASVTDRPGRMPSVRAPTHYPSPRATILYDTMLLSTLRYIRLCYFSLSYTQVFHCYKESAEVSCRIEQEMNSDPSFSIDFDLSHERRLPSDVQRLKSSDARQLIWNPLVDRAMQTIVFQSYSIRRCVDRHKF